MEQSFLAYQMYFDLITKESNMDKALLSELRKIYAQQKTVNISPEAYAFLIVKKDKIVIEKEKSKPLIAISNLKDSIFEASYSKEEQMIAYAKQYIGVPYRYGGTSSNGFDCSGYTQHVLGEYGYVIPRSARYQKQKLNKIPIKKAKKGDLVFFSKNRRVISHVGLVISEEGEDLTMIHASSSRGIMITNVATNTYWKPKLMSAGRVD
jgi:cell wall-associated NlpC family hydrolase